MTGMIERVARALATKHYKDRFKREAEDPLVRDNVENNWAIFMDDAGVAVGEMLLPSDWMLMRGTMYLREKPQDPRVFSEMIRATLMPEDV